MPFEVNNYVYENELIFAYCDIFKPSSLYPMYEWQLRAGTPLQTVTSLIQWLKQFSFQASRSTSVHSSANRNSLYPFNSRELMLPVQIFSETVQTGTDGAERAKEADKSYKADKADKVERIVQLGDRKEIDNQLVAWRRLQKPPTVKHTAHTMLELYIARAKTILSFGTPENKRELLPHQQTGLNWLLRNEAIKRGCILGDDSKMGKTLQILALIVATKPLENESSSPTLIISLPGSLQMTWAKETRDLKNYGATLSFVIHHQGMVEIYDPRTRRSKMESECIQSPERLERFDIVFTTFATVLNEFKSGNSVLSLVNWRRIIIDDAMNTEIKISTSGDGRAKSKSKSSTKKKTSKKKLKNSDGDGDGDAPKKSPRKKSKSKNDMELIDEDENKKTNESSTSTSTSRISLHSLTRTTLGALQKMFTGNYNFILLTNVKWFGRAIDWHDLQSLLQIKPYCIQEWQGNHGDERHYEMIHDILLKRQRLSYQDALIKPSTHLLQYPDQLIKRHDFKMNLTPVYFEKIIHRLSHLLFQTRSITSTNSAAFATSAIASATSDSHMDTDENANANANADMTRLQKKKEKRAKKHSKLCHLWNEEKEKLLKITLAWWQKTPKKLIKYFKKSIKASTNNETREEFDLELTKTVMECKEKFPHEFSAFVSLIGTDSTSIGKNKHKFFKTIKKCPSLFYETGRISQLKQVVQTVLRKEPFSTQYEMQGPLRKICEMRHLQFIAVGGSALGMSRGQNGSGNGNGNGSGSGSGSGSGGEGIINGNGAMLDILHAFLNAVYHHHEEEIFQQYLSKKGGNIFKTTTDEWEFIRLLVKHKMISLTPASISQWLDKMLSSKAELKSNNIISYLQDTNAAWSDPIVFTQMVIDSYDQARQNPELLYLFQTKKKSKSLVLKSSSTTALAAASKLLAELNSNGSSNDEKNNGAMEDEQDQEETENDTDMLTGISSIGGMSDVFSRHANSNSSSNSNSSHILSSIPNMNGTGMRMIGGSGSGIGLIGFMDSRTNLNGTGNGVGESSDLSSGSSFNSTKNAKRLKKEQAKKTAFNKQVYSFDDFTWQVESLTVNIIQDFIRLSQTIGGGVGGVGAEKEKEKKTDVVDEKKNPSHVDALIRHREILGNEKMIIVCDSTESMHWARVVVEKVWNDSHSSDSLNSSCHVMYDGKTATGTYDQAFANTIMEGTFIHSWEKFLKDEKKEKERKKEKETTDDNVEMNRDETKIVQWETSGIVGKQMAMDLFQYNESCRVFIILHGVTGLQLNSARNIYLFGHDSYSTMNPINPEEYLKYVETGGQFRDIYLYRG